MIEAVMYFGIGFLVAALLGLVIVPLVHGRAVRLTMRRLEAATPLSMAEIQADKDQLRAEFAMSTRRLEMSVEQLKAKTTSQLAELGKKGDAINQLKLELGEKTAAIFALEARDKALRDQLRATEEEVAAKTSIMHEAERTLSDKEADLAKLISALDERSAQAASQKAEIDALKSEVETLKPQLAAASSELKAVENRRDIERVELKAATQDLAEERAHAEALSRRGAELEQQLAVQTKEAEMLGQRAQDLESRLGEHMRLLNQSEFELNQTRNELLVTRKTENDLRSALAELRDRASAAIDQFKSEKAALHADIGRITDERDRLARDLAAMKREAEEIWAAERVENALLRERINDVAAEVARMASALEGPNSPIDAILAAETARDRAGAAPAGAAEIADPAAGNGDLADRIRALQGHASRVPRGGKPPSRN
jgi:chromosome segregation ATPase